MDENQESRNDGARCELVDMLAGFKSGRISYEEIQRYLGNGEKLEGNNEVGREKNKRKSGIRSDRQLPRKIQALKKDIGRPFGSQVTADRNLIIILTMISLYEEWACPKRGRAGKILEMISLSKVGRQISKRSLERILKEWNDFKQEEVYRNDDVLSILSWHELVERFKEHYVKKYGIKKLNFTKFL